MWPIRFDRRQARVRWDNSLVWFRLRYQEAQRPSQCLRLLSRPQACGRVALFFQPDPAVSRLFLGVPESRMRLLQQMVTDFDFSLRPKPVDIRIPVGQRLTAATELPWERPFLAHIVNEYLFVSSVDGGPRKNAWRRRGSYLPQPSRQADNKPMPRWRLPLTPVSGLSARPFWHGPAAPPALIATQPEPSRWPLGWSAAGQPLHAAGRINIYGRQEAVSDWLVQQVTQIVSLDPANLVILDGSGDLVPQLKRKAAVTRLLGEQLVYLDIDGSSLAYGLNPLAAVPGETDTGRLQRWQRWFEGMNVHPQGVQLLSQAMVDGVEDIPSLRTWLKQAERQGQTAAVSSLQLALTRLTANRSLREWLEWPVHHFHILSTGAFLFACQDTSWERRQMLRAVLLQALALKSVRLVVHGFPWDKAHVDTRAVQAEIVSSNGPPLPDSTIILAESRGQAVATLTRQFLKDDLQMGENLELLRCGEGIIIKNEQHFFCSWHREK